MALKEKKISWWLVYKTNYETRTGWHQRTVKRKFLSEAKAKKWWNLNNGTLTGWKEFIEISEEEA